MGPKKNPGSIPGGGISGTPAGSKNSKEEKIMTFKQLVVLISEIKNEEDYWEACGKIDISFQKEKITWKDHEVLFNILRNFHFVK